MTYLGSPRFPDADRSAIEHFSLSRSNKSRNQLTGWNLLRQDLYWRRTRRIFQLYKMDISTSSSLPANLHSAKSPNVARSGSFRNPIPNSEAHQRLRTTNQGIYAKDGYLNSLEDMPSGSKPQHTETPTRITNSLPAGLLVKSQSSRTYHWLKLSIRWIIILYCSISVMTLTTALFGRLHYHHTQANIKSC